MTRCLLVEKALNDMCEASKAFQTQVHRMFAEDGWVTVKTVPCLACPLRRDTLCGFHGDDFYTKGEPSALDEVDQTIVDCFKAKIMPRVGPCGDGVASRPRVERDQFLAATPPEALPELGRASRGRRSGAGFAERTSSDALEQLDTAGRPCTAGALGSACTQDLTGTTSSSLRRTTRQICRRRRG